MQDTRRIIIQTDEEKVIYESRHKPSGTQRDRELGIQIFMLWSTLPVATTYTTF